MTDDSERPQYSEPLFAEIDQPEAALVEIEMIVYGNETTSANVSFGYDGSTPERDKALVHHAIDILTTVHLADELSDCEIRELADGGREFILAEPALTWVRVDHQTRLQFGQVELAIESRFVLRTADRTYDLDPAERAGLWAPARHLPGHRNPSGHVPGRTPSRHIRERRVPGGSARSDLRSVEHRQRILVPSGRL